MLFVWGKRSYGAVEKVDDVAVKTVFGHLWYLPLFPMASYYVNLKTDAAYQLHRINWRSVLCGYLRVWMPVLIALTLIANMNALSQGVGAGSLLFLMLTAGALAASYVYDRKRVDPLDARLRLLMARHFGVALDPYACSVSPQAEIDAKMRAASSLPLDGAWYRAVLKDLFADRDSVELALLRARCERQDKALQQTVLEKLAAGAV